MGTLHIHAPQPDQVKIRMTRCPVCERSSPFVVAHTPWYGFTATCLRCGDKWTDGKRHDRPFAPRWRRSNINAAKTLWRRHNTAPTQPPITP
jgi:hypothetical protein